MQRVHHSSPKEALFPEITFGCPALLFPLLLTLLRRCQLFSLLLSLLNPGLDGHSCIANDRRKTHAPSQMVTLCYVYGTSRLHSCMANLLIQHQGVGGEPVGCSMNCPNARRSLPPWPTHQLSCFPFLHFWSCSSASFRFSTSASQGHDKST